MIGTIGKRVGLRTSSRTRVAGSAALAEEVAHEFVQRGPLLRARRLAVELMHATREVRALPGEAERQRGDIEPLAEPVLHGRIDAIGPERCDECDAHRVPK